MDAGIISDAQLPSFTVRTFIHERQVQKPVSTMHLLGELLLFIKDFLCNPGLKNILPGAMEDNATVFKH